MLSWATLNKGPTGSRTWRALRFEQNHALDVFAAIREGDGKRAVLFECGIQAAPKWRLRFDSEGLTLTDERQSGEGVMQIALALEREDLEPVFLVIAEDLVRASTPASTAAEALETIASRLSAWQTCLKLRRDGFGQERMLGLFGELTLLERLAERIGLADAIRHWSGPDRGLHDFIASSKALEVKTSKGTAGLIRVGSLDQLDDTGLTDLILCRVVVVPNDNGIDLDALVARLRQAADLCGHGMRQTFDRCLLLTGYLDSSGREERFDRLDVVAIEPYRIGPGFPRLTSATVVPGIVAAEYVLDPTAAAALRLDDEQLRSVFLSFGMGG
jgi:hypothetical protein